MIGSSETILVLPAFMFMYQCSDFSAHVKKKRCSTSVYLHVSVFWVVGSSATILVLPAFIENERQAVADMEMQQQREVFYASEYHLMCVCGGGGGGGGVSGFHIRFENRILSRATIVKSRLPEKTFLVCSTS